MNAYKVALFGHRELIDYDKVEDRLFTLLRTLIREKDLLEVYVGRNGEFDVLAATVVKRAQKTFGRERCSLLLILPYASKDIEYYEQYYDGIIIPACAEKSHPKGAITKRNRWMVEQCDLLLCFVEQNRGGAFAAWKYAQSLGIKTANLAHDDFMECFPSQIF